MPSRRREKITAVASLTVLLLSMFVIFSEDRAVAAATKVKKYASRISQPAKRQNKSAPRTRKKPPVKTTKLTGNTYPAPDVKTDYIRPRSYYSTRSPRFPEVRARAIDWPRAVARIREEISATPGVRLGLLVEDLKDGHRFEYNADRRFASASLVKIPLALALYEDIQLGRVNPDDSPRFLEKHRIGGSGVLKSERAGGRVPMEDLLYLMLAKSDNTATNILTDVVGMKRVNEVCRKNGWNKTNMVREVMELQLRRKGIENWTTPREMAEMMKKLYREEWVSPESSRELLAYMLNPPIDDRLPRLIPRDIDVVHKTGLIADNCHDIGILYLPGEQPVLVSALVDNIGTRYRDGKYLIAHVAKILYEEATPPEARGAPRRR